MARAVCSTTTCRLRSEITLIGADSVISMEVVEVPYAQVLSVSERFPIYFVQNADETLSLQLI